MKHNDNTLDMLAAMLPGGAGIELQEAIGQQELVESSTLPVDGLEWKYNGEKYEVSPKQYLETLGFVFGDVDPDDELFINVTLPVGWKIEATDHSMWSSLVDDKGRNRAGIFYKAAFYDRSASISLNARFSQQMIYESDELFVAGTIQNKVLDMGEVVHVTEPKHFKEEHDEAYWKMQDESQADAVAWLDEKYPDWHNPMAYYE